MGNGRTFALDIARFVEKAKGQEDAFVRGFCNRLFYEVVRNTPVDTGFLRGSWGAVLNGRYTPSPDAITTVLTGYKPGDVVGLRNTASYAAFVEFGTSRMAPRAFVRNTLRRAQSIAKQTLQEVAK